MYCAMVQSVYLPVHSLKAVIVCGNKIYSELDAKISPTLKAFHSVENELILLTFEKELHKKSPCQ